MGMGKGHNAQRARGQIERVRPAKSESKPGLGPIGRRLAVAKAKANAKKNKDGQSSS